MAGTRGVKAWIVRWEASGPHAETYAKDGEVVAVLPARWTEPRVRDVVERLYQERAYTPSELVAWRRSGSSPYPVGRSHSIDGVEVIDFAVYCGHNPFLRAFKVEGLFAPNENTLEWDEFDPGRDPSPRRHQIWTRSDGTS